MAPSALRCIGSADGQHGVAISVYRGAAKHVLKAEHNMDRCVRGRLLHSTLFYVILLFAVPLDVRLWEVSNAQWNLKRARKREATEIDLFENGGVAVCFEHGL